MSRVDEALEKLGHIQTDYTDFLRQHGEASEADTRIKLIDRTIKEVLGWSEGSISREDYTEGEKAGYTDYILTVRSKRSMLIEAKRSAVEFALPPKAHHRRLKLSTILKQKGNLADAVKQARTYCDDQNIRYSVLSNGITWVVFRALREDIPWRDGLAWVFADLDDITENFFDFWKLLASESFEQYLIDQEFTTHVAYKTAQTRVLDLLHSPDAPLQRNRLHVDLDKVINGFFKDIASKNRLDILHQCYIYSESLAKYTDNIATILRSRIPFFIRHEKSFEVVTGKSHSGIFEKRLTQKIKKSDSDLLLVLGSIGSGKTTFLKRYLRLTAADFLDSESCWFYIDFLSAPPNSSRVEEFIYDEISEQIHSRYSALFVENRRNIKKAYKDKIERLNETTLKVLDLPQDEYEKALSPYLEDWVKDNKDYTQRILKELQRRGKAIIVFIDNVDQLLQDVQSTIFLTAQFITKSIECITLLSLREETFYSARTQKIFTAYANQKFHISSPSFLKMIGKRISYAIKCLGLPDPEISEIIESEAPVDKTSIVDFLRIIEASIFNNNRNINKLIFSLCFGNMRQALDFFSLFLISGATDVDKMLKIYRREGSYTIAFHEFVKSVMLGERKHYKESASNILNLYAYSPNRNASHFTSFRVLNCLLKRQSVASPEGRGYVSIDEMLMLFDDVFYNREDVVFWCNRLIKKNIVETNTHSMESISDAVLIRVTPAGWYYMRYLSLKFAYIDLIIADTPIESETTLSGIFDLTIAIENTPNTDAAKLEKTKKRFAKVDLFLRYLKKQENEELRRIPSLSSSAEFGTSIMDPIITFYEDD